MASPAKRRQEDWDVEGYLHNVSPAKNSKKNNKYFTAVIQSGRREFHRVVSFSMEKLSPFSHASNTGTAVKLRNVRRSLSYSDPNGFDVICNRTTCLDVVSVPFSSSAPPSSTRLSVADVKALGPRQNVGKLEAKVMSRAAVSKIVLVKKEECELKEIWQSGEIRLTTTPSSKIKEIPPLYVPDRDDDPGDSASSATLRGVVSDQGDNSLTLSDLCLTTYFDKYGIQHSPNDLESIEEHFRSEFEMT
ncbi:unnamed protein product [Leuciscus chuanchicus]